MTFKEKLERLKELEKKATVSPWKPATPGQFGENWEIGWFYAGCDRKKVDWIVQTDRVGTWEYEGRGTAEDDAKLMAESRNLLPELIENYSKAVEALKFYAKEAAKWGKCIKCGEHVATGDGMDELRKARLEGAKAMQKEMFQELRSLEASAISLVPPGREALKICFDAIRAIKPEEVVK